jgi:hypothetical protein
MLDEYSANCPLPPLIRHFLNLLRPKSHVNIPSWFLSHEHTLTEQIQTIHKNDNVETPKKAKPIINYLRRRAAHTNEMKYRSV